MRAFVLLSAALAATVVRAQSGNNGCALIVSGPPKSALFDQVQYQQLILIPHIKSVAFPAIILLDNAVTMKFTSSLS